MATPPVPQFLTTWRADPLTIGVILVASVAYLLGVRAARRRGHAWPLRRTLMFFGLGLGSYAVIELGFLGTFSAELRWAFTTRIALLIFIVPTLVAAGQPLALVENATGPVGAERMSRVLNWRIFRLFGNAIFATIFVAALFCLFLTPVSWLLRGTPWIEAALGVAVPLFGMVMVLPLAAAAGITTGFFITVEFLLGFVEMLIDSIPGILMRINETVLDHAPVITGAGSWWPNPLRDQQLSGDMMWLIAEVADAPILVILAIRWMRLDRREARSYDDLTDEEYEALTQAHLNGTAGAVAVESSGHVTTRPPDARAVRDAPGTDP